MFLMIKVQEILCKSAIGKCGFRFMKRFTGHTEEWGTFVDVKMNIAEVLEKQLRSPKYKGERIYIGTVTDSYQPLEKKYKLTRSILKVLLNYQNPISILTKSDMVLRDLDLLKQFKEVDVNFTITTLDEKWKKLVEPNSSTARQRLRAMKKLTDEGITVFAMMGPYWPVFTDPEALFKKFKKVGVEHVFTESFNTIGGNWTGVADVLRKRYPKLFLEMHRTMFNKKKFDEFYNQAARKIRQLSKKYKIPVTIHFAVGHAAKFK